MRVSWLQPHVTAIEDTVADVDAVSEVMEVGKYVGRC